MQDKMKVLIVEDDQLVQSLLKFVFEEQNYDVLCVEDESQAWQTYINHQNEINVVICEKDLYRGSGIQLYQKLRTHNQKIKFIMTSAWCDNCCAQFKADQNFFSLDKPFKVDVLKEFVATSSHHAFQSK